MQAIDNDNVRDEIEIMQSLTGSVAAKMEKKGPSSMHMITCVCYIQA